jgi:hypothetical protein
MLNTVEINLIAQYAINIGSSYDLKIQLNNNPDLSNYDGLCQIRDSDDNLILSPTIEVLSNDIFSIKISPTDFVNTSPGTFLYDVLFNHKTDNSKFYPVAGKCQIVKRVTRV